MLEIPVLLGTGRCHCRDSVGIVASCGNPEARRNHRGRHNPTDRGRSSCCLNGDGVPKKSFGSLTTQSQIVEGDENAIRDTKVGCDEMSEAAKSG